MVTSYDTEINTQTLAYNCSRLTNQIFRLLPTNEEGKDWIKPLETIILEVAGLASLLPANHKLYELLCKLEGLKTLGVDIDFLWFRRIIFECCSLTKKIEEELKQEE
jgi:hypothetical protein